MLCSRCRHAQQVWSGAKLHRSFSSPTASAASARHQQHCVYSLGGMVICGSAGDVAATGLRIQLLYLHSNSSPASHAEQAYKCRVTAAAGVVAITCKFISQITLNGADMLLLAQIAFALASSSSASVDVSNWRYCNCCMCC